MTDLRLCPTCGAPLSTGRGPEACPRCMMRAGFASTGGVGSGGASAPPPAPAELAADFPQLEVLELLGRGGMGAVYKARHKSLDRLVALKLLTVGEDADPSFAERFEREARALASLNHPNVVAVYDSGRAGGRYYLVMEYVDGTDLRRMERAGRIEPREALAIVSQVCEALQYAHDRGVVHRDIKPENILVDTKGNVKIVDFGLAKLLGREGDAYALTRSDQAMGTLHYMAPEQVERPLAVDHRADIFSLGVVFYELLTGELPLGRFDPPSRKVQVDVRVDEVVLKTLEKDPPRRYQHASEVKTDVEGIQRGAAAAGAASSGAVAGHGAHGGFARRHGTGRAWLWGTGLAALASVPLAFLVHSALLQGQGHRPVGAVLLVTALLGIGALAALAFLVLLLARATRAEEGAGRPAWPWVLGGAVLLLIVLPLGCGAILVTLGTRVTKVRAREAEMHALEAAAEAERRWIEAQTYGGAELAVPPEAPVEPPEPSEPVERPR